MVDLGDGAGMLVTDSDLSRHAALYGTREWSARPATSQDLAHYSCDRCGAMDWSDNCCKLGARR